MIERLHFHFPIKNIRPFFAFITAFSRIIIINFLKLQNLVLWWTLWFVSFSRFSGIPIRINFYLEWLQSFTISSVFTLFQALIITFTLWFILYTVTWWFSHHIINWLCSFWGKTTENNKNSKGKFLSTEFMILWLSKLIFQAFGFSPNYIQATEKWSLRQGKQIRWFLPLP